MAATMATILTINIPQGCCSLHNYPHPHLVLWQQNPTNNSILHSRHPLHPLLLIAHPRSLKHRILHTLYPPSTHQRRHLLLLLFLKNAKAAAAAETKEQSQKHAWPNFATHVPLSPPSQVHPPSRLVQNRKAASTGTSRQIQDTDRRHHAPVLRGR